LRQIGFDADFVKEDWCRKVHLGYVISGEKSVDFNGTIKQ
jgi:hypothetical protein